MIANFCGQVAVFNSETRRWRRVTGGMIRRKTHGDYPNFWGQASLGVLGGTAYF